MNLLNLNSQLLKLSSSFKLSAFALITLFLFNTQAIANTNSSNSSSSSNSSNSTDSAISSDPNALSQLKEILGPVSSLQGNFHQKIVNEKGKVLQQTSGKMWLKRPGQFRWEVAGNSKRTVVSDGKFVWDFDPELSQVTVQSLPKKKGSMPIYFLTGNINAIDNDFTVKTYGENGHCLQGSDTCFELIPKSSSSSFQWMRIGFKNNTLRELELFDQMGQHSVFNFQNLAKNGGVTSNHFKFTPPQGVDVVRN